MGDNKGFGFVRRQFVALSSPIATSDPQMPGAPLIPRVNSDASRAMQIAPILVRLCARNGLFVPKSVLLYKARCDKVVFAGPEAPGPLCGSGLQVGPRGRLKGWSRGASQEASSGVAHERRPSVARVGFGLVLGSVWGGCGVVLGSTCRVVGSSRQKCPSRPSSGVKPARIGPNSAGKVWVNPRGS